MSSSHSHSWQAALEADSRTVLRCALYVDQCFWNCWTIIESSAVSETKLGRRQMMLPHSYGAVGFSTSNFFEVPCSIQKVVKFKGRINVQLPLSLLAGCTRSWFENSFKMCIVRWPMFLELLDNYWIISRLRNQTRKKTNDVATFLWGRRILNK